MTATATDLRRKTAELLDAVKRGRSVEIEAHGKPVASLGPAARTMSFGELADMMEAAGPDPETAAAVNEQIQLARAERALRDSLP